MKAGKFLKLTAIYLLLTLCVFSAKSTDEESTVIVLNDSNFNDEVAKYQYLLIEFYAPWCGHCKSLEPEYNKAAKLLRGQNSKIHLAKVDAIENSELAKRFEIQGYPTMKFLRNVEYLDYTGGRTADEIVEWVIKKSGPPSVELKTVSDVERFRVKGEFVYVYFGNQNSEKFNFYKTLADKYDYIFGHSFKEDVKKQYKVNDKIVLFKNFDELRTDYNGELTEAAFEEFTDTYGVPLLGRFSERVVEVIFDKNKVGLFYLRDDHSPKDVALDRVLKTLAPAYRKKIIFVASDIKDELEERLAEYYGITDKDLPQLRITNVVNEEEIKNYVFNKEFNQANIEKFLKDFLDNKLIPTLKSEPIPKTQDTAVYKVVGKSFNEVVIETDKNVLVEFYAPWCGHCKNFEPVYEEIAKEFKNEGSDIVIAKMDATENEVEGVNIAGFPTIRLYQAGNKPNFIEYEGGRGKWDVYDWVKEQVEPAYKKPDRRDAQSQFKTQDNIKDDL